MLSNHQIPTHANKKFVPKGIPSSTGQPFQVIASHHDGINLEVQDPGTGTVIATHSQNTRLMPNGRIYALPKMKPKEKDNPLDRINPKKNKGCIVKEARSNLFLPKSKHQNIEHPFLSSDEDDVSSVDGNTEIHDDGDCQASPECKEPIGDNITWIFCEGNCGRWLHIICEGIDEADINADEQYICKQCTN